MYNEHLPLCLMAPHIIEKDIVTTFIHYTIDEGIIEANEGIIISL
jgi:hypothetical protein